MKNHMQADNILAMLQARDNICISIIIPTHRLSPERQIDPIEARKVISKAKEYVLQRYKNEKIKNLVDAIDELYGEVDFVHVNYGLGIFVSQTVRQLIYFSFPVQEKIIVGDSFEVRDLLYEMNYSSRYYFLAITEKNARLYEGQLSHLIEVKDHNFPKEYREEYLYEHPSRGNSYVGHAFTKGAEKDKSILEEIRHQQFFRDVDELLDDYLHTDIPLIVSAVSKELASFKKVSRHATKIIASIEGNYTYIAPAELEKKVWETFRHTVDESKMRLLKEYEEKTGAGLGVEGLEEVWKATSEGRGFKLLVEKDFKKTGFTVTRDHSNLHTLQPPERHKTLPDAVDDLIELVLEKNGEVTFLEKDELKDHQHIALITRY
jgi:hypothetical protein